MDKAVLMFALLGGLFAALVAWAIFRRVAVALFRALVTSCLPIEERTLQWLQDRAMARALGVDVDVVRMRRRMETLREPMDVKGESGYQQAVSSEGWD